MARKARQEAAFSLFAFQDIITSVTGIMILVTLVLALELTERVETQNASVLAAMEGIDQTVKDTDVLAKKVAENQKLIDQLKKSLVAGKKRIAGTAGLDPKALKNELSNSESVNQDLEGDIAILTQELAKVSQELNYVKAQSEQSTDKQEAKKLQNRIVELNRQLQAMKASNRIIYHPTQGDEKKPWLVEISQGMLQVAEAGPDSVAQRLESVAAFERWLNQMNSQEVYLVILPKPSGIEEFLAVRALVKQKGFDRGYDLLAEDQTAVAKLEGP